MGRPSKKDLSLNNLQARCYQTRCSRFELADFTVHLQCSLIINEQLLIRSYLWDLCNDGNQRVTAR